MNPLHRARARRQFRVIAMTALVAFATAWLGTPVRAAISMLDDAELFLVIWDPVREISYVRDLGVSADSFFNQAQVDAGYQVFFPRITGAGDERFQRLLDRIAPAAQQQNLGAVPYITESAFGFVATTLKDRLRWAVLGVDADGFDYPDLRAFHTLQQGPGNGTLNPAYGVLRTLLNDNLAQAILPMGEQLVNTLNGGTDVAADNTHVQDGLSTVYSQHGSSFTPKGVPGYFDAPGTEFYRLSSGALVPITNAVGKSSWFYFTTPSSTDGLEKVLIDEFDNLSADGYWGLDQDPADGAFVLSFTLDGSATAAALRLREFAAGIGRTEIGGGFVVRKLEGAAAAGLETGASFASRTLGGLAYDGLASGPAVMGTVMAVVPEPHSAVLTLAGLIGLAAWARGRRRR